jgi:hypothetical protein
MKGSVETYIDTPGGILNWLFLDINLQQADCTIGTFVNTCTTARAILYIHDRDVID